MCHRVLPPTGRASSKVPQRSARLACWGHCALTEFESPIMATWPSPDGPPRGPMGGRTHGGRLSRWSRLLAAGQAPLVLGGECTLAIALVAAVVGRYGEVGLLYVDGGQDLMIPADHPREPILDAMGVAHMLDLPGCVPELAGIGSRRPLLQPADVAFVGFVGDEEDVHGLGVGTEVAGRGGGRQPGSRWSTCVDSVAPSTSRPALRCRRCRCSRPAPSRHRHLWDRRAAGPCRAAAWDSCCRPRVVGMSIVEANPDHDPDGTSIRRLLAVIAGALAAAD